MAGVVEGLVFWSAPLPDVQRVTNGVPAARHTISVWYEGRLSPVITGALNYWPAMVTAVLCDGTGRYTQATPLVWHNTVS